MTYVVYVVEFKFKHETDWNYLSTGLSIEDAKMDIAFSVRSDSEPMMYRIIKFNRGVEVESK